MLKFPRFVNLILTILLAAVLVVGLSFFLSAAATTADENYSIILDGLDAPAAGRAAPYGQWIVTHNTVADITSTLNYGTVARTNGYDSLKTVYCYNSGAYTATLSLFTRTTSSGTVYEQQLYWATVNPSARKVISYTDIAPWTSIGITSTNAVTGTTMLCGIYVQTP